MTAQNENRADWRHIAFVGMAALALIIAVAVAAHADEALGQVNAPHVSGTYTGSAPLTVPVSPNLRSMPAATSLEDIYLFTPDGRVISLAEHLRLGLTRNDLGVGADSFARDLFLGNVARIEAGLDPVTGWSRNYLSHNPFAQPPAPLPDADTPVKGLGLTVARTMLNLLGGRIGDDTPMHLVRRSWMPPPGPAITVGPLAGTSRGLAGEYQQEIGYLINPDLQDQAAAFEADSRPTSR